MQQITDISELRAIQLGIIDNIHDFCMSRGIKYSLGYGTLLGAIRHKGYIPWDDDIDVYLMRRDYERLLREYADPTGVYRLIGPHNTHPYFYTFAKVIDTRTLMIEHETEGYDIGVYVDVFPLDYVPDVMASRHRVFRLKHLLYKIRRCKLSHGQYLRSALANFCYRHLPISVSGVDWLLNRFVRRTQPARFICDLSETDRPVGGCFPVEAFSNTIDVPFEDRTYKAMAGYDEYLANTYGDYMTLPPENQRVHHHFTAYWK